MFKKILVPIDLSHTELLSRAISAACMLAKSYQAEIVFAGVYGNVPSAAANFPDEYRAKLEAFATQQGNAHEISASGLPVFSHDPTAELCSLILSAIDETRSDCVVMASHVPGWVEHIFHSNAGYVASHSKVSVFVIRES